MTHIEFPEMRAQVLDAIESLADVEHQQRIWIEKDYPHPGYYEDFTLNVNLLYDDTLVLPAPENAIGSVLHPDEVEPLRRLGAALDELLDDLGDASDEEFLADRRWSGIVDRATAVRDVMREHAGS
ncbi:hypothetical protein LZ318_12940 [Saccharopolyspora indica]|uniref:SCO4402 family protein n=1 Tax=Saccharopolyspora indica TaxID=1229659 RepID=UPI0022EA1947|nr:hypothetical protein [Saccharopolyspora indica]MDA3647199.1 hypothetical protein [Saccharopolyspora indica]